MKKKNRNEETVPLLDLTPRLKRPLKLWNPLDYLRLLYWAFFFPQALRWYIEKFGKSEYRDARGYKAVKEVIRSDPVQRRFIIQAFFTLIFISLVTAWGLFALGIPINLGILAFGVVFGVAGGAVFGVAGGVAFGVAVGVAVGVTRGVSFGVAGGVAFGVAFGVAGGAKFGVMEGVTMGASFILLFILTIFITLYRFLDYIILLLPGKFICGLGKKKQQ